MKGSAKVAVEDESTMLANLKEPLRGGKCLYPAAVARCRPIRIPFLSPNGAAYASLGQRSGKLRPMNRALYGRSKPLRFRAPIQGFRRLDILPRALP